LEGGEDVSQINTDNQTIRRLLEDLRGGGFNTSITVVGATFIGQKVIAFENGVVFTVDQNGLARATVIGDIQSVDF
jgi:hypothetical protein